MQYDDYITEFLYCSEHYPISFVKYKYNETEDEKEEVIRYFSKHFPDYKFYNSFHHTAFFFKKIDNAGD